MGGPGSGRRPVEEEHPIAAEDLRWLFRGLRKRLLAGEEPAQTEFLQRLDVLKLRGRISARQHAALTRSAEVRFNVTARTRGEARIGRLEAVSQALEEKRHRRGQLDRDAGPPPDDLANEGKQE